MSEETPVVYTIDAKDAATLCAALQFALTKMRETMSNKEPMQATWDLIEATEGLLARFCKQQA